MHRREFIRNCALGAAAFANGGWRTDAIPTDSAQKNWMWVPLAPDRSADEWKQLFATARESGIRAILPEIYDGRNAYFPSNHLPVMTKVYPPYDYGLQRVRARLIQEEVGYRSDPDRQRRSEGSSLGRRLAQVSLGYGGGPGERLSRSGCA